jgi:outer membrane protein OmpA-like peptidoglycan-associated protein
MRAILTFIFFAVYALMVRWYYVCQMRGACEDVAVAARETELDLRLKTLSLRNADSVILSGFDHFAFEQGAALPRLNADNRQFLDALAQYLQQHPQFNLTISGEYRPSEAGISAGIFENIGLARADEVRRLLLERKVPENRISLDFAPAGTEDLIRPLAFSAYPAETPGEYQKNQFSFTNMTFSDANFASGSDEFRPGPSFVLYADSVKAFLERNPKATLTIVGHTDDAGEAQANQTLSLRRAQSAMQYFRELGADVRRIKTMGKGESEPTTSNDNTDGRQKNRRVNFILE